MTIEIEGVWKHGNIIPLEEVEVEENTRVLIQISEPPQKRKSLAGVWKDYRTKEGEILDVVKKEIYDSRHISTRREVV